jgi:ATP-dependent Lon protease
MNDKPIKKPINKPITKPTKNPIIKPIKKSITKPRRKSDSRIIIDLPMIPLRGLTIFPGITLSFDVARDRSRLAIEAAMAGSQLLFLVAQIDISVEWPSPDEIYQIGCVARIRQIVEQPGNEGTVKLLVEGLRRASLGRVVQSEPYYLVEVNQIPLNTEEIDLPELEAYRRRLVHSLEKYAAASGKISPEALIAIGNLSDANETADMIAANLAIHHTEKQSLLESIGLIERIRKMIIILGREQHIAELEKDIDEKVRSTIEKNQKDYFLREQMKVIQRELGEQESVQDEVNTYSELLKNKKIPEDAKPRLEKEISRMSRLPAGYPEGAVLRNYLDLVFEMPWGKVDEEHLDIAKARKILDRDHYGLKKVKERILEYLAVRKLRIDAGQSGSKGPILCLVGPPGTGKTSIARSVADALGRKYTRMSLGGIHDEAEIRGHRRTYVGAMPGRIINAIRQIGTDNPLILLDEIDKVGSDFRGDPSSALLEVLDPEQNSAFRDHFLEIPYNLSRVLFITTANTTETIPQALLDRMEIVPISGYTEEEKIEIVIRHLYAHQLSANALKRSQLTLTRDAIRTLISGYTREAGVRQLEREIAHVCRRAAILIAEGKQQKVRVTSEQLDEFIGRRKYHFEKAQEKDQIGVATGLAWTFAGGDTLNIEVNVMNGSGKLELTGQLGDVMKESARAAVTYIRTIVDTLGIDPEFAAKKDIHIHVPEGATPKDGPSAGITLAVALASALSGRPVRHNVAMTGEITLRGRVLPIGGLKEKIIAANRAGIDTVLIPIENERDLEDIPESVLKKLRIVPVRMMDDVLREALIIL